MEVRGHLPRGFVSPRDGIYDGIYQIESATDLTGWHGAFEASEIEVFAV